MEHYKHLSLKQRQRIFECLKAGWTLSEIATLIGVHKSTVSREVRRNRAGGVYKSEQAHRVAEERSVRSHRINYLLSLGEISEIGTRKIAADASPKAETNLAVVE